MLFRSWNTGILLYSLAQYPEAEKWCGLGMSFIRHLGSQQESYQTQVHEPGCQGGRGRGTVREMNEAALERWWQWSETVAESSLHIWGAVGKRTWPTSTEPQSSM